MTLGQFWLSVCVTIIAVTKPTRLMNEVPAPGETGKVEGAFSEGRDAAWASGAEHCLQIGGWRGITDPSKAALLLHLAGAL
jgi:hypothetical protein